MKKLLSVLLIAAALFGFYGGAVNLNDVLACKDYWEVKGEESTADMNKLEDGINQLKENEQAYLDGIDQLADGEQALAEGEHVLAAGRQTLAKGEADYAAAPGKLKEGKKSLSDLTKLINGLNKANTSFNNYSVGDDGTRGMSWNTGFEKKAAKADYSDAGLEQARKVITATLNTAENKKNVALIGSLANNNHLLDDINNAKTYQQYDQAIKNMISAFDTAQKTLEQLSALARANSQETAQSAQLKAGLKNKTIINGIRICDLMPDKLTRFYSELAAQDLEGLQSALKVLKDQGIETIPDGYPYAGESVSLKIRELQEYIEARDALRQLIGGRAQVSASVNEIINKAGDKLSLLGSLDPRLASLGTAMQTLASNNCSNETFSDTLAGMQQGLAILADVLDQKIAQIKSNKATFQSWDDGYQQLKSGQDQLADKKSGIPYAFSQMMSNATLRKALKKSVPGTYAKLAKYTGTRLASDDMDEFNEDMKEITSMINKIMPVLKKVKADGQKTYNQGLKDYKAAPAKLASGRAQLAEGAQALVDGRKQLDDGKAKLAEYEDGEQQVRDGLSTLMNTEPDGGLTSILDRRSGDADFDNGDEHLDLDEGLEAVDVGRGYQADSGELITKELTSRGIGSAAGIGAGVLAVLAALLSFLKKNKAAGVFAVLSAIAGAAGVAIGTGAGMEFSDIAGSVVGSMPWVACGVLAGVALVHAIAHFTGSKAA